MEAKCPKCEATDFGLTKRKDKAYCYVTCKKCGTVVGVLEDIDFGERYKTIIGNQQGIDRHISQLEMKVQEYTKRYDELQEIVENTNSMIFQMAKRIR